MNAQIHEVFYWVSETEPSVLKDSVNAILHHANFTCLDCVEHNFTPQGYTGLWLLAESHLAVHTFPEQEKSYIQLSCCNEEKYQQFVDAFTLHFTPL